MNDKISISSSSSFFLKFIIPIIGIATITLYTIVGIIYFEKLEKWMLISLVIIILTYLILKDIISLKKIMIDDYNYYISNYIKSITVPRTHQMSVDQISYSGIVELVKITFYPKTYFGHYIIFSPKKRFLFHNYKYLTTDHKIVGQLDKLKK